MTLNLPFCEANGCDQVRTIRGNLVCNLCDQLIYGMTPADCPRMKQTLAEARTEGRQQAAAELDRSAGQPVQTYVEKQSLKQMLTAMGCGIHKSEQRALRADAGSLAVVRREQVNLVNQILKNVIAGTSLKEVEL